MSASAPVLIMAGGTGGHIFPALAVAHELRATGWRVVWLGNPEGMEARLVPQHDFEMVWVKFSALRGKGLLRKLLLPVNLLRGFWQGLQAIRQVRPNVVLGMGGYITFPGGMMASLLNRPLAIHEQNSIAGLANKVLARVADKVMVAFPDALPKADFTGNPVRSDIAWLPSPIMRYAARSGPLNVLVVGGSLGAAALNEAVPQALALLPPATRPYVKHQSGAKHIECLRRNYENAGVAASLVAFIDDMATAYADADLVICRAGATTVAEVAAAGVAALFVPFPHAVDDHQTANARYLSERGAALLVPQSELTPQRLADLLAGLTRERLVAMAQKARALAKPNATRAVADLCAALATKETEHAT